MNLADISTWIAIVSYSLGVFLAIVCLGVAIVEWLSWHARIWLYLGVGSGCGVIFVASLAMIASDWFPRFSGEYVALMIRLSFLGIVISGFGVLTSYLRQRGRFISGK